MLHRVEEKKNILHTIGRRKEGYFEIVNTVLLLCHLLINNVHISITYVVIVLMPRHVSKLYHCLLGVAASFILKLKRHYY
jgi:hypothetical protein